ncbi:MAG: PASTA domain-containing protein [Treponema sp.]|nr:PASTA domain-containing protein [Treponema sp.]
MSIEIYDEEHQGASTEGFGMDNADKSKQTKAKKKGFGLSVKNQVESFSNGGLPLLVTIILAFAAVVISCLAVFFTSVQGEEKVMVPNVVGKPWSTAFLEMQAKELYPKLYLRYSDRPGEEGLVLDQNPPGETIVKAYQRIEVTVSRGIAVDSIENYVGQDIDAVQTRLQTLFSGNTLVDVRPAVYQKSTAKAGTILAQYPAEGTVISDPIKLFLIASSGSEAPKVTVPNFTGISIDKLLEVMQNSKLVFEFKSHDAAGGEAPGTVTATDKAGAEVEAFSTVTLDLAFPVRGEADETVYGVLTFNLPEYPYPVPVRLESTDAEGNTREITTISHPGKQVQIPYAVTKGSVLTLYAMDSTVAQQTVN